MEELARPASPDLHPTVFKSSVAEELVPSIPDPCLLLERVNGYTGEFTRSLMWSPSSDEAVFACNATVVAMAADGSKQRCDKKPRVLISYLCVSRRFRF